MEENNTNLTIHTIIHYLCIKPYKILEIISLGMHMAIQKSNMQDEG